MRIVAALIKAVIFAAEKISAELALLAALLSTAHAGEISERVVGGMLAVMKALAAFAAAYARDMSFAEFMEGFRAGINSALDRVAANVQADPREVLLGMLATYVSYKALSALLGLLRKKLLGRGRRRDNPGTSRRSPDRKGRTFEQLYESSEPSSHHASASDEAHRE